MSKDAKLGLVLGIGLVIIIAVVFFRKDTVQARGAPESTAAASVKPKSSLATPVISDIAQPTTGRLHTVAAGDTLFNIAQRYYDNSARFIVIYEANRERLIAPDRLEPGTVLVIPE